MDEKIIKVGGVKASSKDASEKKTTKTTSKAKKTVTTKKESTAKITKTTKSKATTKSKTKAVEKDTKTASAIEDTKKINVDTSEDVNVELNTNVSIGSDGSLEVPSDIIEDETKEAVNDVKEEKKEEKVEDTKEAVNEAPVSDDNMIRNIVTAGDRNCYLYFDIKTTSTTKHGEPISIGIVDANRNIFYAEFVGYMVPPMNPTFLAIMNALTNANPGTLTSARNRFIRGSYKEIGEALREWLSVYYEQENVKVQFMGDKLINEQVILYDLILDGKEISERPSYLSPVAMDLNSELAHVTSKPTETPIENYVPAMFLASSVPLTAICGNKTYKWTENSEGFLNKTADNALATAAMIKTIHQGLWGIEEKTVTPEDFV